MTTLLLTARHALGAAAFAMMTLTLLGGAAAQPITITHKQGETVLPAIPQKVLVFDLASLDTLDALGVPVAGVPGSNLPEYLSRYSGDDYLKIGSLFEPDYEVVAAAAPDLIIVAARSSPALPELAKIAPTIDLSNDWADFENSIKANSRILGEIFGKSAEIETMIGELDAKIAAVKANAADKGNALVVLTSGGKVTAFGPGSRFGWIHDSLGVPPAVADVEAATHGEAVSSEFLLETNPDWLFVIDRDAGTGTAGISAEQTLSNELVAQTKAWQAGNVVYVDPARSYIVNGGLPAFTVLVDQVGAALAK